ncbi:peptidase C65 Otubain-domain-containing protein [Apodospora peruviana]|uniref:ubiquitinyl hydrolase 1 n=1 Tax=Apodospora peruviana TaxID=516989 RepID=A0AAE0MH07_9PEZI|nr:peptidase C65 Otubain-domain-containing protein [Apodospora peruviana]
MYQPETAAYIQQVSSGYGIAHSLPQYTFEETPLGLSSGGGGSGSGGGAVGGGSYGASGHSHGLGGPGTAGAGGGAGAPGAGLAGALIYTTPIFSTTRGTVGPASGLGAGPFHFHQQAQHHHNGHNQNVNHNHIHAQNHNTIATHHQSVSPHSAVKMESNTDDLAAQEAAARDYQPQPEGPLVGPKTPSTAITEEYAKGDPIYVQKTMALPQTYSHYRPIRGDGSCGWRAIGFGYFETLINRGDKALILAEKARLESLNDYIEKVGGMVLFIFQDMADETFALLQKISETLDDRKQALADLMDAFNEPQISDSIVYHLRLLASAWLKGNREPYADFITSDRGIDGYCESNILANHREMDHISLNLLVDVLLKPTGFVLEVVYLDRSAGPQVNTYRFPEEARNQHPSALGPMIHLLFRPDHYDILYPVDMDLQVHRVASFSHNFQIAPDPVALQDYAAPDLQVLSVIPGYSAPPPGLAPLVDATTGSPLTSYTSSPGSPWMSSPFADPTHQQHQHQAPPAPIPISAPAVVPLQAHPLRFSEYCQLREYTDNDTWREPTFQTTTFKNSHFNVAHYNNPNFQPEEYKPGADEFENLSPRSGGGRKRGSV